MVTSEQQEAREYVRWVEERIPQMDSGEYLEWFDGEGRELYLAEAATAGMEPKE